MICPHCDTNVSDPVKKKSNRDKSDRITALTKNAIGNALKDQVSKKQKDAEAKKEKKAA